jgi:hypothetical protein
MAETICNTTGPATSLYFCDNRLTVDRCNGLRCSLTKNAFAVGLMRDRSAARPLRRRAHAGTSEAVGSGRAPRFGLVRGTDELLLHLAAAP